ncbi:MAG: ATP-binding protein [Gaiellaceae bacterium]
MSNFTRPQFEIALARAQEPRRRIQVLAGPRQGGKTTIARQLLERVPGHYASADDPAGQDRDWIVQQWEVGRTLGDALLVLDEVQKVPGWAHVVKALWDEDTAAKSKLRVYVLGSAPLLVQRGLAETLAGRFELIRVPHWSFGEMREAFGWGSSRYLFFGGYPGAADLAEDVPRWRAYILDSLVETSIARDVLLMTRVDKPALLRQLFRLACDYSGQVLSYTKMLGQLQDAGNTTTLAHYLELLEGAGLVAGIQKYSGSQVRRRASSPKLLVLNTALMSASSGLSYTDAKRDRAFWGRLLETAVGAHLWNRADELWYWREGNLEVDWVARAGRRLASYEVKSGRRRESLPGMAAFAARYRPDRRLLVGAGGLAVEDFLAKA